MDTFHNPHDVKALCSAVAQFHAASVAFSTNLACFMLHGYAATVSNRHCVMGHCVMYFSPVLSRDATATTLQTLRSCFAL